MDLPAFEEKGSNISIGRGVSFSRANGGWVMRKEEFEKELEERASWILGTRTAGFEPLKAFRALPLKERKRLIEAAKRFPISGDE